jgi:hypothetical protein
LVVSQKKHTPAIIFIRDKDGKLTPN